MKKVLVFLLGAAMLGGTMSCGNSSKTELKTTDDSLAYYFGSLYGSMVKQQIVNGMDSGKFDKNEFLKNVKLVLSADTNVNAVQGLNVGMTLLMNGVQLRQSEGVDIDLNKLYKYMVVAMESDTNVVDMGYANVAIQNLLESKKAQAPEAIANKEAGAKYIQEQMAADPEIKVTPSGLAYKVIKEGNGENFVSNDRINVIYTGTHIDGSVFDTSDGEPRTFSPNGVVPGFKEALLMMSPGAEYIVYIPGDLAYGVKGTGGGIGPCETLVFTISTPSLYTPESK